jgi:NAD+ diphosphatase
MTKYADRSLPQWVLISGFVEAGETLEEAAEREVYEETGIRIRDLQYFGSQPWGFSGSVIAGYTARLDGPDGIRFDRKELAAAEWHPRTGHPRTGHPDGLTDISIAYEMIEALRL